MLREIAAARLDRRERCAGLGNLHLVGRAGLFRYDNSDQAILTGLAAARAYLGAARSGARAETVYA